MPPPSALQVGFVATFGSTQCPLHRSLLPFRASLHFTTATRAKLTTRFYALLNNHTQTEHRGLSIKRRAAEVSNEGKIDEKEEDEEEEGASIAQGPDEDVPEGGQEFAQFAAGQFMFPFLAFQKVPGVTQIQIGYSQGRVHNPKINTIKSGRSGHAEVLRIQYDPTEVSYDHLLDTFWECHDPTQKNRQGYFLGPQYRSGIYFYSPEQEKAARQSLERQQKRLDKIFFTEILPAKKFYRAKKETNRRFLWERRLMGGQKLSASWLDVHKLPAAIGLEDPVKG